MKFWQIGASEGIGGLKQGERDDPQPAPGDMLVKVVAAGLNYRDLMVLTGRYNSQPPETRIPLADGVGVVEAVGEGVSQFAPGDRVIAPHFLSWLEGDYSYAVFARDLGVTADGWLAEKILLPAEAAIAVPASVSDETAATLSAVGATVWHAMVTFGGAGAGDLVLSQGTGGVSLFAMQLAKALGADCVITSSSEEKLARAQELGADVTVNYRDRADWAAAMLEATDGRGADVVVDTLGFSALGQTVEASAVGARIGTVGALSGTPQDVASASQGAIIGKNITIKGIASGSRDMLAGALQTVANHSIEMEIGGEFGFDEAPAAYRHLESGAHMGKVLIRCG